MSLRGRDMQNPTRPFSFAFGPSLLGVIRDGAGAYGPALGVCVALPAVAAAIIMLGPGRAPPPR